MGPTLSRRLDITTMRSLRNEAHITRSKILTLSQQLRRLSRGDRYVGRSNAMFALKDSSVWTSDVESLRGDDITSKIVQELIVRSVHSHSGKVDVVTLCCSLGCLGIGSVMDTLELAYRVTDYSTSGTLSYDDLAAMVYAMALCLEQPDVSGEYCDSSAEIRECLLQYLKSETVPIHTEAGMVMGHPAQGLSLEQYMVAIQRHPIVQMFL
eukprot:PhM_4_TR5994/c0_g2_i1/m.47014